MKFKSLDCLCQVFIKSVLAIGVMTSLPVMSASLSEFQIHLTHKMDGRYGDIQGNLAVGGKVKLSDYQLGFTDRDEPLSIALVSKSNIRFKHGAVAAGSILAGGSVDKIVDVDISQSQVSGNVRVLPVDFDLEKTRLKTLSQALANTAANGTIKSNWWGLTLKGDCQDKVQVFNVEAKTLARAWSFNHECIPDNASVIINVKGKRAKFSFKYPYRFSNLAPRLLFNFPEARTLSMYAVSWPGSILAPNANFKSSFATFNGQIVAKSWDNKFITAEDTRFAGWLPGGSENQAPVIDSEAPVSAQATLVYRYRVEATDPDNDTLSYRLDSAPDGMSITENLLTWTPTPEQIGEHTFTITVSDGVENTLQVITVSVAPAPNTPPVIDSEALTIATENTVYSYVLTATDADIPAQELSYSLATAPQGMTITGNHISWTPDFDQAGPHSVVATVSDGTASVEQKFVINVKNTNRAPVISSTPLLLADEDVLYLYQVATADLDGDVVSLTLKTAPAQMSINADNQLIWMPNYDQAGSHNVTLEVSDGSASVSQSFIIQVANSNRAPVFNSLPVTSGTENVGYRYTLIASDADGQALSFGLVSGPTGLSLNGNTLLWTPDFEQAGDHSVVVIASDGSAGTSQFFSILVANNNREPVITSSAPTAAEEDQLISYSIEATDDDKDTLTYELVGSPPAMEMNDNKLTWTPVRGDQGQVSFTVKVSDGQDYAEQNIGLIVAAGDADDDGYLDEVEENCLSDKNDPASIPADNDADGSCDVVDSDDDNDGVIDIDDAFPFDASESVDTDADGTGNNADLDDDNDSWTDTNEATCGTDSLDSNSVPADNDGDKSCDVVDNDDDNDGVTDIDDAFPFDASESVDTDADGTGNHADLDDDNDSWNDTDEATCGTDSLDSNSAPADNDGDKSCDVVDSDDDNDGVADIDDAFPFDASESADIDGDGIGDNSDADRDGDGISNDYEIQVGSDPNSAASVPPDLDRDGIPDSLDTDRDGDGVDNNEDAYGDDATKTQLQAVNSVTATLQGNAVILAWESYPDAGFVTGYRIYRETVDSGAAQAATLLQQVSNQQNNYLDNAADNASGYRYRVVAVDINGHEGAQGELIAIFVAYNQAAIQGLQAQRQGPDAMVNWTAIAGMRYQLYRSDNSQNTAQLTQQSAVQYLDDGALWNQEYYYQVAAIADFTDVFTGQLISVVGPVSEAVRLAPAPSLGVIDIDDTQVVGENRLEYMLMSDADSVALSGQYQDAFGPVQITATAQSQSAVTSQSDDGRFRLLLPFVANTQWQITVTDMSVADRSRTVQLNIMADTVVPQIDISSNPQGDIDQDYVSISGSASDSGSGIAQLYATSDRLGSQQYAVATAGNQFSVELPMERGSNVITIHAVDHRNNQASASVTVKRSLSLMPEVVIHSPLAGTIYTATTRVQGVIYSALPAEQLTVSLGSEQLFPTQLELGVYQFTFDGVRLMPGYNPLVVSVSSPAGNANAQVGVTYVSDIPQPQSSPAPVISLTSPKNSFTVNTPLVALAGWVSSPIGIKSVTLGGLELPLSGATSNEQVFRFDLDISAYGEGAHNIILLATDTLGQTSELTLPLVYDTQAPLLNIDNAQLEPTINQVVQQPLTLKGRVSDINLAAFSINNQPVGLLPGAVAGEYEFEVNLDLASGAQQSVMVQARDYAGNVSESSLLFNVVASVDIELISPRDGAQIMASAQGAQIDVAVRLQGLLAEHKIEVTLDQGIAQQMLVDGNAATATIATSVFEGEHSLLIRILDSQANVVSALQSQVVLVNTEDMELAVVRTEPQNNAVNTPTNQVITVYFNQAIDPTLIEVVVLESVHGLDYDLSNQVGKSFIDLPEPELVEVHRDMAPVNGGLLFSPDNRFVSFQAANLYAYDAQLYVEVKYDGASIGRYQYQVKPLPTLLVGTLTDQVQTPLGGINISFPELGLTTKTNSQGNYRLRIEKTGMQNGRYRQVINGGLDNPLYGSQESYVDIEAGRLNRLTRKMLPQLSDTVPFVTISSGEQVSLVQGRLQLDLTEGSLLFPNGRDSGAVHVQFTPLHYFTVAVDISAFPGWLYAVQPSGIQVEGDVGVQINMPLPTDSVAYTPEDGTYVAIVGFDPNLKMVVPIGVGQVQNKQVYSVGKLALQSLNYIGYVLMGEEGQAVLRKYASEQNSSPALLRSELIRLVAP